MGKSTLFNKLVGSRRAIVGDEPGITRDRLYGDAEWRGRHMRVVDTGGILPAMFAALGSKVTVLEMLPPGQENTENTAGARKLVLDVPEITAGAETFEGGESASETQTAAAPREIRIAIIGHPNVGKSTLLNRLTGSSRTIVSPIPGTTRDAVDEMIERNGRSFRFIDTAGIRRKGKTELMAEKLSVVMARKHLEAADIALLVIDATEGVSALDAAIAGYAHESGRSIIILVNKWDLVTSGQRRAGRESKAARMQASKRPTDRPAYEQRLRYELKFLSYAPVLFVSAASGEGTERILPMIEEVAAERRKRIGTGEMNRFVKTVDFERAGVPARQQVKIYYMTQASVAPPTFVLFTDRAVKLHFSYQRFLENQIRRAFGFVGTPIWIKNRSRD